jgi:uncharacterized protein YecE (DUF72 family)
MIAATSGVREPECGLSALTESAVLNRLIVRVAFMADQGNGVRQGSLTRAFDANTSERVRSPILRNSPPEMRIGTSGWHYASWRGPFYPESMKKDFLPFYRQHFDTAEINASFYRLPKQSVVECWRDTSPENFVFAWKASRFITHMKKLKDVEDSMALVHERMSHLGSKMGPVLYQLPPSLKIDRERLADFFKLLPPGTRSTLEFRHPSWYEPAIFELLADHDVSLCISDHAAAPAPWVRTASFVYVRGHGPSGHYWGSYSEDAFENWAAHLRQWRNEGRDVYCYFDNDIGCEAPRDAKRLMKRLEVEPYAMGL